MSFSLPLHRVNLMANQDNIQDITVKPRVAPREDLNQDLITRPVILPRVTLTDPSQEENRRQEHLVSCPHATRALTLFHLSAGGCFPSVVGRVSL